MPQAEDRAKEIPLPPPRPGATLPVAEALAARRSRREFLDRPLSLEQVSYLCWSAQGVTSDAGYRAAPSAGALYPITMLAVDRWGVFEYIPAGHALAPIREGDVRSELQAAALDQDCVGSAPLCLAIAIDVGAMAGKYGARAERYCVLEAGHVAQNVLLAATATGLAGVPVGAFQDARVKAVLGLPRRLDPVYLLPIGHPTQAGGGRA